MKPIQVVSKISNLFFTRSRTWIEILLSVLHKLSFLASHRCQTTTKDPTSFREETEQVQECNSDHQVTGNESLLEEEQEILKELEKHGLLPEQCSDEESCAFHMNAKGTELKQPENSTSGFHMRLQACTEVLGRLKDIQAMESSELGQFHDLEEVTLCYSLVRNDFYVDLLNQFIADVSDEICKPI